MPDYEIYSMVLTEGAAGPLCHASLIVVMLVIMAIRRDIPCIKSISDWLGTKLPHNVYHNST